MYLLIDASTAAPDLNIHCLTDLMSKNFTLLKNGNKIIPVNSSDPAKALREILDIINRENDETGRGYQDSIVLYAGDIFYLLKANLPCDNIDTLSLFKKLVEVMGGYQTPQQIELVNALFIGGINQAAKR